MNVPHTFMYYTRVSLLSLEPWTFFCNPPFQIPTRHSRHCCHCFAPSFKQDEVATILQLDRLNDCHLFEIQLQYLLFQPFFSWLIISSATSRPQQWYNNVIHSWLFIGRTMYVANFKGRMMWVALRFIQGCTIAHDIIYSPPPQNMPTKFID